MKLRNRKEKAPAKHSRSMTKSSYNKGFIAGESAVSDAGGAGGGIDANLPQGAESALLGFTVAEGVGLGLVGGVFGVAVKLAAAQPIALGFV